MDYKLKTFLVKMFTSDVGTTV